MLRRFVVTWFFNIVALWVAAELIDGIGYSGNEWVARASRRSCSASSTSS